MPNQSTLGVQFLLQEVAWKHSDPLVPSVHFSVSSLYRCQCNDLNPSSNNCFIVICHEFSAPSTPWNNSLRREMIRATARVLDMDDPIFKSHWFCGETGNEEPLAHMSPGSDHKWCPTPGSTRSPHLDIGILQSNPISCAHVRKWD